MANLVRAFVTVKTHPVLLRIRLEGRALEPVEDGYAAWQFLEADQGTVSPPAEPVSSHLS